MSIRLSAANARSRRCIGSGAGRRSASPDVTGNQSGIAIAAGRNPQAGTAAKAFGAGVGEMNETGRNHFGRRESVGNVRMIVVTREDHRQFGAGTAENDVFHRHRVTRLQGASRRRPVAPRQFFDLSTSRFSAIHGIIARSLSPTCSMSCSAARRRIALKLG